MQATEESADEKDNNLFLSITSSNEILIPLTMNSSQVGKHTNPEFNQAFYCLQSSKWYAW